MLDKISDKISKKKFQDKFYTIDGKKRAYVNFSGFETLWFNTGTLCNIECKNCYIKSSPKNDALVYINKSEVKKFLDELDLLKKPKKIGFTGGEPFMNPEIIQILSECLERGYEVLVLTNAMRPIMKHTVSLVKLKNIYKSKLVIRVSIDSFSESVHNQQRGENSFGKTILGLIWLNNNSFKIKVASRMLNFQTENQIREGFKNLFKHYQISLNAYNVDDLVIFPEMSDSLSSPEISTDCWGILPSTPSQLMCSNSRMVVKKKFSKEPNVQSCTLIPYHNDFNLGANLSDSKAKVYLNHRYCSQFCVLGGSKCS